MEASAFNHKPHMSRRCPLPALWRGCGCARNIIEEISGGSCFECTEFSIVIYRTACSKYVHFDPHLTVSAPQHLFTMHPT